ncbi:hypothetical protein [Acanthopleuribacter pedis]|uniref:Uncharacterized protein n=1 Tax=Acanthopleuribacter pedis TaxID=442870 RepID=A0A8J7QH71_9BACT|nr:hypothetical protein [Acanthopleuribacter pedis]MBO1322335.1 hypothetical protein [Acanthopleuribacter pedis]
MFRFLLTAAVAVCLSWATLQAQETDRRRFESEAFNRSEIVKDRIKNTRWKFGDFSLTPIIGLNKVGYDSNVFSTDETREESDFSITPEVGLQSYLRLSPRWVWANRVAYKYQYYTDIDNLRGSEYNFKSTMYGLFRRTYLELGAQYNRENSRLNTETDQRPFIENNEAQILINHELKPRHTIRYQTRWHDLDIKDADIEGLDDLIRSEMRHEVAYFYKPNPNFWPNLTIAHKTFDFDNDQSPLEDSTFTRINAGLRNEFKRRFHYNVSLGMEELDFPKSSQVNDEVFIYAAYMEQKLTRQWYVRGGGQQNPIFSIFDQFNYFVNRRIYAGGGYIFRNKIQLGPVLEVGKNTYDNPRSQDGFRRDDDLQKFSLELELPFQRFYRLKIRAGWSERDSSIEELSDEGFEVISEIYTTRF